MAGEPIPNLHSKISNLKSPRVRYHGILAPNHRWRPEAVPVVRPGSADPGENAGAAFMAARTGRGTPLVGVPSPPFGPPAVLHPAVPSPDSEVEGRLPRRSDAEAGAAPTLSEIVPTLQPPASDFPDTDDLFANRPPTPRSTWAEQPRGWRKGRPHLNWAQLLKRSMDYDALTCPSCGEKMAMIAVIDDPDVVKKILKAMGLPTEAPQADSPERRRWGRAPPVQDAFDFIQDSTLNFPESEIDREID